MVPRVLVVLLALGVLVLGGTGADAQPRTDPVTHAPGVESDTDPSSSVPPAVTGGPGRAAQRAPRDVSPLDVSTATAEDTQTARGSARRPRPDPDPDPPGSSSTLILYDTTGPYGYLGELYAIYAANLVSHFGVWTTKPVVSYEAGEAASYNLVIYLGSTFDEPIPGAFLDDVLHGTTPVYWMHYNIWQLTAREPGFVERYGWAWWFLDDSPVSSVEYKGRTLARYSADAAGIMKYSAVDESIATVLATAIRDDGTTFPWALRSQNLTYIGELPFRYTSERNRHLIFADLLFDVLQPEAVQRHRALVRLEDVSPWTEPQHLRQFADYLASKKIKFGFGVSPLFKDPNGIISGVLNTEIRLRDNKSLVNEIKYLIKKGGVLIEHGYTHQYGTVANPYNGVTGDDFEFFRVVEDADHNLVYVGPVAEDSALWVQSRIEASNAEFKAAGLQLPKIFEFPHYTGSDTAYREVARRFSTRWERVLYFGGSMTGEPIDYGHRIGQMFPYPVTDIYGSKVLPENIGNYEPEPFFQFPAYSVQDVLAGADANLVVRDGFASFYYHSWFGTQPFKDIVQGILDRGYTFADPASL